MHIRIHYMNKVSIYSILLPLKLDIIVNIILRTSSSPPWNFDLVASTSQALLESAQPTPQLDRWNPMDGNPPTLGMIRIQSGKTYGPSSTKERHRGLIAVLVGSH